MESLFVMGNGSAVNCHVMKEQKLSKANLTSIYTNIFVEINFVSTNKPELKNNLNQQLKPNLTYFFHYILLSNTTQLNEITWL